MKPLTARQEAEAIEQFGDELASLSREFDRLCNRLSAHAIDRINGVERQEHIETVAKAFQVLGARMSTECDHAEEAEDRRRTNPLEPDYRRVR